VGEHRKAITGRWLLSIKRSGECKCRGVKQGFKGDKATADGPNFNYSSHVTKFSAARASTLRPNRFNRRIAVKGVSTAFLQYISPAREWTQKALAHERSLITLREWNYSSRADPSTANQAHQYGGNTLLQTGCKRVGLSGGEMSAQSFITQRGTFDPTAVRG